MDTSLQSRHLAQQNLRCLGSDIVNVTGNALLVGHVARQDVSEVGVVLQSRHWMVKFILCNWSTHGVHVRGHVGHGVPVCGACEGSVMWVRWVRACANRHSAEKILSCWGPVEEGHVTRVERQACG